MHVKITGAEDNGAGHTKKLLNRSGNLHVFNRSFLHHSSTAQTHANDLLRVCQTKELLNPTLFLITDGGWDFNVKSDFFFHGTAVQDYA